MRGILIGAALGDPLLVGGRDVGDAMRREHSPLPWRRTAKGPWIATERGALVAHVACAIERRMETADIDAATEANAEFIVRACNAHEALVSALKELRAHSLVQCLCDYAECGCETSKMLVRVDAALALAEGK